MSLSEIISRVANYIRLVGLYFEYHSYRSVQAIRRAEPDCYSFCRRTEPVFDCRVYYSHKEVLFQDCSAEGGHFLGGYWVWNDSSDIWRCSPDTEKLWPMVFFAFIAYRPTNSVGDVRVAWEPSRLQYLLHQAMAYQEARDAEIKSEITAAFSLQFHSWVVQNPYLQGIHYISAMECGLRLIAVCHTVDILRPDLGETTWKEFLVLAQGHANLIARRLSLHSSAGNHTLAEAVSLLYVAILLPEMEKSSQWRVSAVEIINEEVARQILPDGSGYEASTWYLLFIADLVALAIELANKTQLEFDAVVYDRLDKARYFLSALGSNPGNLIRVGDSDDGYALSPLLKLNWGKFDTLEDQRVLLFPDAGISRINLNPDHKTTAQLFLLHTHAGMPPLYGHSHADCLSLLLNVNGYSILSDPGTYTYNGNQHWRRYFRSTSAHNTLVVDGEDQFEQVGTFQWQRPYHSHVEKVEEIDGLLILSAYHDGYSHRGVQHRRTLLIEEQRIFIWDLVTGAGEHDIIMRWHIGGASSGCHDEVVIDAGGYPIHMSWPGQDIKIAGLDVNAGAGCVSSSYGRKMGVYTVFCEQRTILPVELMTVIGFGQSGKSFTAENRIVRVLEKLREKYGV